MWTTALGCRHLSAIVARSKLHLFTPLAFSSFSFLSRQSSSTHRLIRNYTILATLFTFAPTRAVEMAEPIQRLKSGFEHFKKEIYEKNPEKFRQLSESQSPKFLIFACADSRVCPSVLFNFLPGEAFIIRSIANIIPPYDKTRYSGTGAAIEYPVVFLKVENIIVIGHSRCGGIKALLSAQDDGTLSTDFIEDWVKTANPAKEVIKEAHSHLSFEDQCSKCEKGNDMAGARVLVVLLVVTFGDFRRAGWFRCAFFTSLDGPCEASGMLGVSAAC